MVFDVSSVLPVLILAMPVLLLIMFLPAVIELRKPKDAGPRFILNEVFGVSACVLRVSPIVDIEAGWEVGVKPPSKMGSILGFLPVLEA